MQLSPEVNRTIQEMTPMAPKRIVLALACLCLAPVAMAQTASPVTLYGRVYLMLESVEAKGTPPVARRTRLSDRNSILGVRGTEDLGGGLKAFYQLETLFASDEASGTFASRNSGVGLQGAWGSVLFGRWDTPFKVAHAAIVDVFGDLALPDITGATMNQGNFQRREPNSIQYWSPNWRGVAFRGHYATNEGKTATANPYSYGASLVYQAGKLYLAYAHEYHNDQNRTVVTPGVDEEGDAVSATYRLGPVKLSGQYSEYKKTNTTTQKAYYAGVEWNIGQHALLASYQNSKNGGVTTATQPACDLVGLGYRYDFTKRTAFYAEYADVNNKVGSLCNFGTSPLTITAGQDPQAYAFGVRHTF
jgi:predicted porin